eukprot:1176753-Prorocentrum_minimum.AAC.1
MPSRLITTQHSPALAAEMSFEEVEEALLGVADGSAADPRRREEIHALVRQGVPISLRASLWPVCTPPSSSTVAPLQPPPCSPERTLPNSQHAIVRVPTKSPAPSSRERQSTIKRNTPT